jgi:hypothetical protein
VSLSAGNVAVSDKVAREAGYDHLVTSWAVRLSHPETTWIALSDEALGSLSAEQRGWLDSVGRGLGGIDILDEQPMRFERPFHGGLDQRSMRWQTIRNATRRCDCSRNGSRPAICSCPC